jgi:hypothetical protein
MDGNLPSAPASLAEPPSLTAATAEAALVEQTGTLTRTRKGKEKEKEKEKEKGKGRGQERQIGAATDLEAMNTTQPARRTSARNRS